MPSNSKPAGPFVPTTSQSMRLAMAGDDCSLHFDMTQLTEKQQADHLSNQVLTAMLQVALLYIAKDVDEVCLYDTFTNAPWVEALENYRSMFTDLGLDPADNAQISYHPMEGYYESVARRDCDCELNNLYMVSGSNLPVHNNPALLAISQDLNSKVHFAAHAPQAGLPVPATLHCTKADLSSKRVADFFAAYANPDQQAAGLVLKILGLAGARNVTMVTTVTEAMDYVAQYDAHMDIILQERLSTSDYTEMTVDLQVSDTHIQVTNVRRILFAEGLWVGNLLGERVTLPAQHEEILLEVGAYARAHGFSSPQGFNLGIDYFVRNPQAPQTLPELLITEINARWTGGLFPAELVRSLGLQEQNVVAFIDMCPPQSFTDYQGFLRRHLYDKGGDAAFGIAPMGFAPFAMDVEGTDYLFVWQIVVGDFSSFQAAKSNELGAGVLVSAPKISTDL